VRDGKPVTIQTKQTLTAEELAGARDIEYYVMSERSFR